MKMICEETAISLQSRNDHTISVTSVLSSDINSDDALLLMLDIFHVLTMKIPWFTQSRF